MILLFGALVYLIYSIAVIRKFNQGKTKLAFPPSISESFYFMPHWSFVMFLMASLGSIMTVSYLYMDYIGSLNLFSVTNVGALILAGVPAFANMHWSKVRILHLICAGLGFTTIALGFTIDYGMWYWTIIMAIAAGITFLLTRKGKSSLWWVEHALIISMLIGYAFLPIW